MAEIKSYGSNVTASWWATQSLWSLRDSFTWHRIVASGNTDNSGVASSPDESRLADSRNAEHTAVPFSSIKTRRGREGAKPGPSLQAILQRAMGSMEATAAAIALSTEDGVCCRASTGAPAPEVGTRLYAGSGLTRLCFSTGEIQLCNDTNADPRIDPQVCKAIGIRSALVLPIRQNAQVVGVLEVLSIKPNAFNEARAAAASKLAD